MYKLHQILNRRQRFWYFIFLSTIIFIITITTPFSTVKATCRDVTCHVSSSPTSKGFQLTTQAKTLYQTGKFKEAIEIWQKAINAFSSENDITNQVMALSNLSLTYQQLGEWQAATETINKSLKLLNNTSNERVQAQTLDIQGKLQLAKGDFNAAFDSWQKSASIYDNISDTASKIQSQINQSQALQAMGLYNRALTLLTDINKSLEKQPDSELKIKPLLNIGNALIITGKLDDAEQYLQKSLKLAKKFKRPQDESAILLSLGNLARAQNKPNEAIQYYQQVAKSNSPTLQMQAKLNELNLLVKTQQFETAQSAWAPILQQLNNLPPSRSSIYGKINLAQSLICLKQPDLGERKLNSPIVQECGKLIPPAPLNKGGWGDQPKWTEIENILISANEQAQILGDKRALAHVLGYRGGVYQQQRLTKADEFTRKALDLAVSAKATDIEYRWRWQLGRIAWANNDLNTAVSQYTQAFNNLKSLRGDLVATNTDVQFSFRESVEPVYRELVDLVLKQKQPDLKLARDVIESLQLAELDDFFREACVSIEPKLIDTIVDSAKSRTAVVYAFFLPDSLEIILKLPKEELQRYSTEVNQDVASKTIRELKQALPQVERVRDVQKLSQQVYNWLITPLRATLDRSNIKNLVFVLDGGLRNIPMAVLYDGQNYLIEKYAIAVTPGIQMINSRELQQIELIALAAGVSEKREFEGLTFNRLDNVEPELKEIKSLVPNSTKILNDKFTKNNLQRQINSNNFSVVHFATHGQFSSDPKKTYLLLGNGLLKANELNNIVRRTDQNTPKPVELLVLSACETATGDERATLGLAGVAVRAGARSTVATLWAVNDLTTSVFMKQFYQELKNNTTKAEALQRAQIAVLKQEQRPFFWAPYTLVGNWL
jgi:CHAT domain-containing protein/predicted negative regulator of RcsB-dependent stress response